MGLFSDFVDASISNPNAPDFILDAAFRPMLGLSLMASYYTDFLATAQGLEKMGLFSDSVDASISNPNAPDFIPDVAFPPVLGLSSMASYYTDFLATALGLELESDDYFSPNEIQFINDFVYGSEEGRKAEALKMEERVPQVYSGTNKVCSEVHETQMPSFNASGNPLNGAGSLPRFYFVAYPASGISSEEGRKAEAPKMEESGTSKVCKVCREVHETQMPSFEASGLELDSDDYFSPDEIQFINDFVCGSEEGRKAEALKMEESGTSKVCRVCREVHETQMPSFEASGSPLNGAGSLPRFYECWIRIPAYPALIQRRKAEALKMEERGPQVYSGTSKVCRVCREVHETQMPSFNASGSPLNGAGSLPRFYFFYGSDGGRKALKMEERGPQVYSGTSKVCRVCREVHETQMPSCDAGAGGLPRFYFVAYPALDHTK